MEQFIKTVNSLCALPGHEQCDFLVSVTGKCSSVVLSMSAGAPPVNADHRPRRRCARQTHDELPLLSLAV